MAGMLLLNPRSRRKTKGKKRASPRRTRRARKNPLFAKNPRRSRRRRNPFPAMMVANPRHRKRRRRNVARANPHRRHHRRRNPMSGMSGGIIGMLKTAAIGAVGAVGIDLLWNQINPNLPTSMQSNPNTLSAGDAVKVAATVGLGIALNKPTRGWAAKLAAGSLVVQLYDIINANLPASLTGGTAGLGWVQPTAVARGQNWVGPNKHRRMGVLLRPGGSTPLLRGRGMGVLLRPGGSTPLLRAAPGMPLLGSHPTVVQAQHGIAFK